MIWSDSVPEEATAQGWFLIGVVIAGIVTMVITTARYRLRYSPSPQDGLIMAGWIVAGLAVPLSLFAWGEDPHMSISGHLSAAAGAAALMGWLKGPKSQVPHHTRHSFAGRFPGGKLDYHP